VPTANEAVPGYDVSTSFGIGVPRSTPTGIVEKLNSEFNTVLVDPTMKARLADLGIVPAPMSPAEYGTFISDEVEKWGKVIRAANVKSG
jgi:tripartite-type tricarboxylate transporter receptor subunit TctC